MFKKLIKKLLPLAIVKRIKLFHAVLMWSILKIDESPRHALKQYWLKYFQKKYKIKILIETGTYEGAMIEVMKSKFQHICSIELDKNLAQKAKKKFGCYPNIKIINGDSSQILPEILKSVSESCLFWLDAHYAGGNTARGNKETPIMKELQHILNHEFSYNHIILIDDARLFIGKNDYPEIKNLQSFILEKYPQLTFETKDDIIRIYKK